MVNFKLKKYIIFSIYIVLLGQNIYSYPIEELIKALSHPITWAQKKNKFNKYLKTRNLYANKINLDGLDLKYIDFSGMSLEYINFRNSNLEGANFKMASLCYSDLSGANLKNANLHLANLSSANLIGTNLFDANLSYATLDLVKLSDNFNIPFKSEMHQTPVWRWCYALEEERKYWQMLVNAKVRMFNLSHKNELRAALIFNKNFRNADLRNLDLSGFCFRKIDLSKADLTGSNLSDTDLTSANLIGAHLSRANLKNAIISGIKLSNDFTLPLPCKDEQLIEIYYECTNGIIKKLLRQVIIAKDLFIKIE